MTTYTQNKEFIEPGNNSLGWDVPLNTNFVSIDTALGGVYSVSSSGGTVNLSKTDAVASRIAISGSLTSNLIVTIPDNTGGNWVVSNSTTDAVGGPWTVTVKTVSGALSNTVPRSGWDIYYSTGTSVVAGEIYSSTNARLSKLGGTISGNLIVDQGTFTVNNVGTSNALVVSGGNVTAAGNITATGNVTAFSDERLKKDVVEIGNALHRLQQIRGVTYHMHDAKERRAGVIAQEVQKVLPEVVFEHDTGYLHVAYGNLTALLINAVKELAARVEELEKRK